MDSASFLFTFPYPRAVYMDGIPLLVSLTRAGIQLHIHAGECRAPQADILQRRRFRQRLLRQLRRRTGQRITNQLRHNLHVPVLVVRGLIFSR